MAKTAIAAQETLECQSNLRVMAARLMRTVWLIWESWPDGVAKVCERICVLISTVDTAMKAAGGLLNTPVVQTLLKSRPLSLHLVDEVQRCRVWQLAALMLNSRTCVWVGDRLQQLPIMPV